MRKLFINGDGLSNICRLCLSANISSININENCPIMKMTVADTILECASVQVSHLDELPQFICNDCHLQLITINGFRTKAIRSEQTLKLYLKMIKPIKSPIKISIENYSLSKKRVKTESSDSDVQNTPASDDESTDEFEENDYDYKNMDIGETKLQLQIKRKICNNNVYKKPSDIYKRADKIIERCSQSATEIFKCNVCDKIYSDRRKLNSHKWIHSKTEWVECDVYDKKKIRRGSLKRHKSTHSEVKPFKCDACDKRFSVISSLNRHKLTHSAAKSFKCDACDKRFSVISSLNRHKLTHSAAKSFKCDVCDKRFSVISSLNRHKLTHSAAKSFKCDACDKRFSVISSLNRHKLTHSAVKSFKCNVCDKSFLFLSSLKRHKRIHSEAKPFKCNVCDKSFLFQSSLRRHKGIHSRVKQYKCDICNRTYAGESKLSRHKLIHKCDICDKYFSNLYAHRKFTHLKKMVYTCSMCDQRFMLKNNFDSHIRKHIM